MKRSLEITETIQRKINNFWKFVHYFQSDIKNAAADYMPDFEIYQMLRKKLDTISTRIDFRIKLDPDTDQTIITFTGGGYLKLFPKIHALAESFPSIPEWQAKALIDPTTDLEVYKLRQDSVLKWPGIEIRVSEIMSLPTEYDTIYRKMGVRIYLPDFEEVHDNPHIFEALEIIIEDLVGEIVFHKNVSFLEITQLPEDHTGLMPLYQLPEILDDLRFINRKTNRKIGELLA